MLLKTILLKIMMALLLIAITFLAFARTKEFFDWYIWWQFDRQPISQAGYVKSIYSYKGREYGKQRITYKLTDGSMITLRTVFNNHQLEIIKSFKGLSEVQYYPVPTGSAYIFWMKADRQIIYEGKFRDSGWPGFIMFFVLMVQYFFVFILIFFLIKKDGETDGSN